MKFKLFGITWDFKPLLLMLWAMWGGMSMLAVFMLHTFTAFWFVVWLVGLIIWFATADSLGEYLTKE
jgi:hypothetical protein